MEIKEMPIEEKYDKLLDQYLLNEAKNYALHKELGVISKSTDFNVKVQKKMLPSYLGTAFKLFRTISASRAFKSVVNQLMYTFQSTQPLSNMELTWISDREAVIRTKNCTNIKKMRDLVKKAGLDINPRFMCGIDTKTITELAKEFGVDTHMKLEENGCKMTMKLK